MRFYIEHGPDTPPDLREYIDRQTAAVPLPIPLPQSTIWRGLRSLPFVRRYLRAARSNRLAAEAAAREAALVEAFKAQTSEVYPGRGAHRP